MGAFGVEGEEDLAEASEDLAEGSQVAEGLREDGEISENSLFITAEFPLTKNFGLCSAQIETPRFARRTAICWKENK